MTATVLRRGAQASLRMILSASLLLSGAFLCTEAILAEGIEPAKDRPAPKSPADSARCVKLPPGFRLDLVAAEPLVREPSAMAFDERGRLFVCEIHGYNLDGYLDIVELNMTGVLDREVRRVRHATPESQAAAHKETYGTVRREGLEKDLTPQDVADLIGFLRQSLGPVVGANVVLFDDEPDFLKVLTEGDAKISLTGEDKQAGDVALLVSAGQRHSPKIPGWHYQIVENPILPPKRPESGKEKNPVFSQLIQVRFLRFAWKSVGAKGVMFELADNGAWPAATSKLRRYYSGKNLTNWAATEVSSEVPTEWTVVTVDLWKDFGDFTLTGIAPTAMGGPALFDRIELLPALPDLPKVGGTRN